jgi:hypothetical protein
MTSRTKLAAAIVLMIGTTSPLMAAVCKPNAATPFAASAPQIPGNGFASFLTDSEGVGVEICTDAGLCIFDDVLVNDFAQANGFGAEGFWYSAEARFNSSNTSVLLVMAAEAAFLTEIPVDGDQFPFTRLRVRLDLPAAGTYTLVHPYGKKVYTVSAGGRRAVNDTTDIELQAAKDVVLPEGEIPAVNNRGVVGPWLRWTNTTSEGLLAGETPPPAGYIGNAAVAHTVVGSPCNQNFTTLTGVSATNQPISVDPNNSDGDNDPYTLTTNRFFVSGKLSGQTVTPLVINQAYYTKNGGKVDVHVFATAPTTATLTVAAESNNIAPLALNTEHTGRFFQSFEASTTGQVPTSLTVQATNGITSPARTLSNVPVADLVTITKAEARCTRVAPNPAQCNLTVDALSSDPGAATLTITVGTQTQALVNGTTTFPGLSALPSSVTVTSDKLGTAAKPLTVINQ